VKEPKNQSNALFEAAMVALDSLRASKLRSFLTLLGLILSTTTLVSVMAVIHGMDVYVASAASSMGNDGFRVMRMAFIGNFDPKKFIEANRKNPQLSPAEYDFIRENAKLVREIGISAGRSGKISYVGDVVDQIGITGFTANGLTLFNYQVDLGRFFTDTEDTRKREVVFIGPDIKDRFFPNIDPIGKSIGIDGRPFEVVGVAKPRGSVFGQSQDNYVAIPVQTYFKMYGNRSGINYLFLARGRNHLEEAEDEIRVLLRSYRHLAPGADDTFSMVSSDTLVSAWDNLTSVIAGAAVGIVSVFMVVGGVVIMNIMLAVVTERTREIGVRKSVGAKRSDIMNQFLVESSVLAATGGFIGVGISWLAAVLVRNFTPVPMELPMTAVLIGVGLSTIVGLFFGIYPARKASQLDPIVALRAES
jgi:putative ABC transport system permease protein